MNMDIIKAVALCNRYSGGSGGGASFDNVGIEGIDIDDNGHLIFTLADGSTIDAGAFPTQSLATLTIGSKTYDGTEDVEINTYEGATE